MTNSTQLIQDGSDLRRKTSANAVEERTDDTQSAAHSDYARIAAAIGYLEQSYREQPSLDDLAAYLNLSPYHLQRLFRRWAGITPKRFVQYLTVEHAKRLLADSHTVLDATYASGLSSPGRLHDLFVSVEAVTPGEYKQQGAGIRIEYGFHATPFGECLLAVTTRGICALLFADDSRATVLAQLRSQWPQAELIEAPADTQPQLDNIFPPVTFPPSGLTAATSDTSESPVRAKLETERNNNGAQRKVNLLLRGTNFQIKVWEALLRIPSGALTTYGDVAQAIGKPTAARAVGQAAGANSIAFLIPCHRVIRSTGIVQDYRWGKTRKQAMLGWEAAQSDVGQIE